MLKFGKALRKFYAQIDQPNKIRWTYLYLDEDGVYQPQTAAMKCRDFFNDFVAAKHGQPFIIYGFNSGKIKFNEDWVHFRLTGVDESLYANIDTWLSPLCQEYLGQPLQYKTLRKGTCLVSLPIKCLEATYYISLLTWLIRVSNYGDVFSSYEEVFTNTSTTAWACEIRRMTGEIHREKALKFKLSVPEALKGFWFYAHHAINSRDTDKRNYIFQSSVHNNGWLNWTNQKEFTGE